MPHAHSKAPQREPLPYLRGHLHGKGWLRFVRHWLVEHLPHSARSPRPRSMNGRATHGHPEEPRHAA